MFKIRISMIFSTFIVSYSIFLFFAASIVRADSFYPSGDAAYCDFAMSTSISYDGLPNSCTDSSCIQYDLSSVSGESNNYPENHTFNDVSDITYPDAHRYSHVASGISVPPNTTVDIGFYVNNYAGHPVEIRNAYLFISRADKTNGDLHNLGAPYGTLSWRGYKFNSISYRRYGRFLELGNLGTFGANHWSTPPKGQTVNSFETIQPIRIIDHTATTRFENSDLIIDYSLNIENQSNYNLSNLSVNHNLPNGSNFSEIFTLNAGTAIELTYSENMGSSYPSIIQSEGVRISDPNTHKETAAIAGDTIFENSPEAHTILVDRTDYGIGSSWTGRQPDFTASPRRDFFYVELLPYSIFSESLQITVPESEVSIEKVVSDLDEFEVESNTVSINENIIYDIYIKNTGGFSGSLTVEDIINSEFFTIESVILENSDVDYFIETNSQGNGFLINDFYIAYDETVHITLTGKVNSDDIDNFINIVKIIDLSDFTIAEDTVTTSVLPPEIVVETTTPEVLGAANNTLALSGRNLIEGLNNLFSLMSLSGLLGGVSWMTRRLFN